jgi:hypothetical protein
MSLEKDCQAHRETPRDQNNPAPGALNAYNDIQDDCDLPHYNRRKQRHAHGVVPAITWKA